MKDDIYPEFFFHLERAWFKYQRYFQTVQDKPSTKLVHQLRIATRRLEAILELSESLVSTSQSKHLRKGLQKVRRSLGPLRNAQIEIALLRENKNPGLDPLIEFVKMHKKRAKTKALNILDHKRLKGQELLFERVKERFLGERDDRTTFQTSRRVKRQFQCTLREFKKAQLAVPQDKPEAIHHARIIAKRLRYQGEILESVVGPSNLDLPGLRRIQVIVGDIQDKNVLLKDIRQYLGQKAAKRRGAVKDFGQKLTGDRERLTKIAGNILRSNQYRLH